MKSRKLIKLIQSVGLAAAALLPFYGCGTGRDEPSLSAGSNVHTSAIIGGVIAGNGFTNVGDVVVRTSDTDPWFSFCSGTLIAPNVFLSAGHCAFFASAIFGDSVQMGIHFDPVLTSSTVVITDGTWIVHPQFNGHTFILPKPFNHPDTHDLSVFVMNRSIKNIRPAKLPERGSLAGLLTDEDDGEPITITTVGYGVQANAAQDPDQLTAGTRKASTSTLVAVYDTWLQESPGSGISCAGDSGGANLLGSSGLKANKPFVERVISTTTVANCNKPPPNFIMQYRLDTDSALSFLETYVGQDSD